MYKIRNEKLIINKFIKMKESRIIAFVGCYSCLILSNLNIESNFIYAWLFLAIFWGVKYIYLEWKR